MQTLSVVKSLVRSHILKKIRIDLMLNNIFVLSQGEIKI